MIRRLRDTHRRVVTLLALTLPLGYTALLSRRDRAPADPARLAVDVGGRFAVGEAFSLLATPKIDARRLGTRGNWTPDALLIMPSGDPAIPDLLVYWSPNAGDGRQLPPDAILIGALRGSGDQMLPLPDPRMTGGHLILYSLGRGEIVAAVAMRPAT